MISRRGTKRRSCEREVYRNSFLSATKMADDKFQRGVSLFNSREFFLAHEVWEELWLEEVEPEKTFLQGLIQAAAGFHHYIRGNFTGAQSLLASAAVKLRRSPARHRGIAAGELLADVISWARILGDEKDPEREKLPQITST
jgi:uncharacterized protein